MVAPAYAKLRRQGHRLRLRQRGPEEADQLAGAGPPRRPGAASRARRDGDTADGAGSCACHAWARMAGGWPWLRRAKAAPSRGGCRACQHASTRMRRTWVLPALVMLPRRVAVAGGVLARDQAEVRHELPRVREAWKSPSSASRIIAARVSIPRKQRSQPTRSR